MGKTPEEITSLELKNREMEEDFARIKILIRANVMGDLSVTTMRKRAYDIAVKHGHGIHFSMDEEGELISEE